MGRHSSIAVIGLIALAGSIAAAQDTKPVKPAIKSTTPAAQPEGVPAFELPPDMTPEYIQACTEAGTPGEMHAELAELAGTWHGKTTMWMTPQAEAMQSECTTVYTPMMDGRYVKCETTGDMGGMLFTGFGLVGFDNVAEQFQSTWVDNCGTGMMTGTGERSSDGKTMSWTFDYNCPVTKKPTVFRQVERRTGEDTMSFEMYGTFAPTGKEYKMLVIEYERVSDETAAKSASAAPASAGN